MKMLTVAIMAAGIMLSGCSTTVGLIPPDDLYPKALTQCTPEPTVPPRPAAHKRRSDSAKAQYLHDLHGAYADCKDAVTGWSQRRDLYAKQYDQQTNGYFSRVWHTITNQPDSTGSKK